MNYEEYKKSHPNLSDEEIINELLGEIESIKNRTFISKKNDANLVFPEFEKEILGYYEIESKSGKEKTIHPVFCLSQLDSITESKTGKTPHYRDNSDYSGVSLKYWWYLPFVSQIIKRVE